MAPVSHSVQSPGTLARWSRRARSGRRWFLILLLPLLASCQAVGRTTVEVEFASRPSLEPGAPVYLKGIQIGTAGSPRVVAGAKIAVPVYLDRSGRDALSSSTVFLVSDDPARPGRKCLKAVVVDANSGPLAKGARLRGANSLADLVGVFGQGLGDLIRRSLGDSTSQ